MNPSNDLRQWYRDPARTVDELCALEIVIGWGQTMWRAKREQFVNDYEQQRAHRKEREGNPAYVPKIDLIALDRTREMVPVLKSFMSIYTDDRPVRSVAPFRFLTELEELWLTHAELTDLSPLQSLTKLRLLLVTLTEEILWVTDHMRTKAEEMMGRTAEDWHSLPMAPAERPRPYS